MAWNFHKDCIYYDTVQKTPKPERKHKGRLYISCEKCKEHGFNGMHYYCDSDFENIRTDCRFFEPAEPTLFDYMEEQDG